MEDKIGFFTKAKAKLFGKAEQASMTNAIQVTGKLIGRQKDDFRDTAAELIQHANRLRAKELGISSRLLLDNWRNGYLIKFHNT